MFYIFKAHRDRAGKVLGSWSRMLQPNKWLNIDTNWPTIMQLRKKKKKQFLAKIILFIKIKLNG